MTPSHYPLDPSSYLIVGEIGVGPISAVYKAECVPLNNTIVAIKKIFLDHRSKGIDPDRIMLDANAMSLLSHPNILKVHCSFIVEREVWIIMEYMFAGCMELSLSAAEEDSICVILKETLKGLCYLHDRGYRHGNLKLGNILIGPDWSVKLADFGVSGSIQDSLLSDPKSYWIAPEVIHSKVGMGSYSYKGDVWGFGVTAAELASGQPLCFSKDTEMFRFPCREKSIVRRMKYASYSEALKDLLRSCLREEPAKRPTCAALLNHRFFTDCRGTTMTLKSAFLKLPRRIRDDDVPIKQADTSSNPITPPDHVSKEGAGSMTMKQGHKAGPSDPTAPDPVSKEDCCMTKMKQGHEAGPSDLTTGHVSSKGGSRSMLLVPLLRSLVCILEAQKDIISLMAQSMEEGERPEAAGDESKRPSSSGR